MNKTPILLSFAIGCTLGFTASSLWSPGLAPGGPESALESEPAASTPGDVEARAREILNGSDPLTRLIELGELLQSAGPDDVEALREAFEYAPLDGGDPELVMMGLWWAHFDPEAAYIWTTTDWRAQYGSVIAAVFRVWGRSDPEAAFQMANGVLFPSQRNIAVDATIAGWEESGGPGLMEFLRSLKNTDQQRLGEIIGRRRVVTMGPEEAIRWAQALEPASFRRIMSLRVASAAAAFRHGAPFAAKWAEPLILAAERPTGYPRRIGTRWIRHDPEAAMVWLASLPEGWDRDDGVTESFRDWHRRDPKAARAWLGEVPMERWIEPAFSIYARMLAREDPEAAIAIAGRISDPKYQRQTYITVGRVWTEDDASAAAAWFAQSGLPEDVVKHATSVGSTPRRERMRAEARAREAGEDPEAPDELD